MKFATIVVSALATCSSFLAVGAQAPQVPVHDSKLAPPPLESLLGRPGTFYRAVTRGEVPHIGNYPLKKNPTGYNPVVGDFAHNGGLYVFSNHEEALKWGDSFSSFPKPMKWYLVAFKYTPDKKMKTHSFLTGTPEWKKFVNDNYGSSPPKTTYDIVEGPISHGSGSGLSPYIDSTGHMIYQAAFTSRAALHTLVVDSVTPFTPKGPKRPSWCPDCHIM